MQTISYHQQIPVAAQTDVLVAGGGPAGIAAAIAAARAGCRVMLVEQNGYLGGMATAGLVTPMMKTYSIDGSKQIIRGIFEQIVRRMEKKGGAMHPSDVPAGSTLSGFLTFGQDHITPFEPEALKLVADELMREHGVRVFFHAQFIDALTEGGRISAVVIADKSGMRAIEAKLVIDCTGDADVAQRSGVPCACGGEGGVTQPATMMFRVGHVDTAATKQYVREHPEDFMFIALASKARENGDFPINRRRAIIMETLHPGQWIVNGTRIQHFTGVDADQKSLGEMEGRRQVEVCLYFLRKYIPGFEHAVLLETAAEIGVRETRHIRGKYTLTAEDVMTGKHFEDCVALSGFPMDTHDPNGTADQFVQPEGIDCYEIPYGCLVPQTVANLLVAGRSVSATHEAFAAIRVMPTCMAMGEAAGAAAAIALADGVSPWDISIPKLRQTLLTNDVCLEMPK